VRETWFYTALLVCKLFVGFISSALKRIMSTVVTVGAWVSVSQLSSIDRMNTKKPSSERGQRGPTRVAAAQQWLQERTGVVQTEGRVGVDQGNAPATNPLYAVVNATDHISKKVHPTPSESSQPFNGSATCEEGPPLVRSLWVDSSGTLRSCGEDGTPTSRSIVPSRIYRKEPASVCEVLVATMERSNWKRALRKLESKRRLALEETWEVEFRSLMFAWNRWCEKSLTSEVFNATAIRQCEMAERAHRAEVHDRWVTLLNRYMGAESVARDRVNAMSFRREGRRLGVREDVVDARKTHRLDRLDVLLRNINGRASTTPSTAVSTAGRPVTSGEMKRREARWASEATKAATSLRMELLAPLRLQGKF
jgi:hypothetical protein